MMMWIVLGIITYLVIAIVTFIACVDDGFVQSLSTAVFWPVLVMIAAISAIITAVAFVAVSAVHLSVCAFQKLINSQY